MKQLSITAAKLAELVKGRISGDPERVINGVCGIKDAGADQLSFIGNKKYEHQLETAKAGIILVCEDMANAPHRPQNAQQVYRGGRCGRTFASGRLLGYSRFRPYRTTHQRHHRVGSTMARTHRPRPVGLEGCTGCHILQQRSTGL